MDQRQCAKCLSTVDAAKAFCPECGNSMEIEQERKTPTLHSTYEGTERITQSAYNMMIKEMDLDISESPPLKETVEEPKIQSVTENRPKSSKFWIIIGAAAFVLLMFCILVFAGVFFYMR